LPCGLSTYVSASRWRRSAARATHKRNNALLEECDFCTVPAVVWSFRLRLLAVKSEVQGPKTSPRKTASPAYVFLRWH
jgi:hypothetical protein